MRESCCIATICLLLSACGTTSLAPVSYEDTVTVQSVLPVHVRLNTTESAIYSPRTIHVAGLRAAPAVSDDKPSTSFNRDDQSAFVDSLKSELIRHGVFGSISEHGARGVVDLDFYFIETGHDPETGELRLNVAMAAGYRGEMAYFSYALRSREGKAGIAAALLNAVMGDVQAFADEQQLSIRAGVKNRNLDIGRMLVKW